jgi:hypothetical protein
MPVKRIIKKSNVANDIMSSKLNDMFRNAIMESVRTGKACEVVLNPFPIKQSNDDELILDGFTFYMNCSSCSKETIMNELQNGECQICLWVKLKERIVLNDEENMNLAGRVDFFNDECDDLGITMTPHIFKCLKNFYRIDDEHVAFNTKNKKMRVRGGCDNEPYNVYR